VVAKEKGGLREGTGRPPSERESDIEEKNRRGAEPGALPGSSTTNVDEKRGRARRPTGRGRASLVRKKGGSAAVSHGEKGREKHHVPGKAPQREKAKKKEPIKLQRGEGRFEKKGGKEATSRDRGVAKKRKGTSSTRFEQKKAVADKREGVGQKKTGRAVSRGKEAVLRRKELLDLGQ